MDNWMIYQDAEDIRVGAIDNGLGFCYKHPDSWRSYPYSWAILPIAGVPFSPGTRAAVSRCLRSPAWWRETLGGLEDLFRVDPGFEPGMFRRQVSVMRGQAWVLLEVLASPGGSPLDLVRAPSCYVMGATEADLGDTLGSRIERVSRGACFKSC
jgi:hypothetical protein